MKRKDIENILKKVKPMNQKMISTVAELKKYYNKEADAYIFNGGLMLLCDFDIDRPIYTTFMFASNLKVSDIFALETVKVDNLVTDSVYAKAVVILENVIANTIEYETILTVNGDNNCKNVIKIETE